MRLLLSPEKEVLIPRDVRHTTYCKSWKILGMEQKMSPIKDLIKVVSQKGDAITQAI